MTRPLHRWEPPHTEPAYWLAPRWIRFVNDCFESLRALPMFRRWG